MTDGPITDSASVCQRIRRLRREIVVAAIITVAALISLGAANWQWNATRTAGTLSAPEMKVADRPAN
jgi:hypothetical protein